MTAENFSETTSSVARQAGVLAETVRLYGKLGLLECLRLPNGIRLFKPSAADRVRKI
jgi:DNA-binding transcriptional MerR regulator